jgi:hypothetical protein
MIETGKTEAPVSQQVMHYKDPPCSKTLRLQSFTSNGDVTLNISSLSTSAREEPVWRSTTGLGKVPCRPYDLTHQHNVWCASPFGSKDGFSLSSISTK